MACVRARPAQALEELSFSKKLKLAKVGDEDAQLAVARAYEVGKQVKRNRLEAAKWYAPLPSRAMWKLSFAWDDSFIRAETA